MRQTVGDASLKLGNRELMEEHSWHYGDLVGMGPRQYSPPGWGAKMSLVREWYPWSPCDGPRQVGASSPIPSAKSFFTEPNLLEHAKLLIAATSQA